MLWLGTHLPRLALEVFSAVRAGGSGSTAASGGAAEAAAKVNEEAAAKVNEEAEVVVEDGRVVLLNPAAAARGIVPGSTLATAHSIAPGLVHYHRDPEREQRRLVLLAETLYGFSPRVSLAPPAGVVMEIGGSVRLFGDAAELTRRVQALCHDLGHQVRVRHAATPLAALVLARSDASGLSEVPLKEAAVEPEVLTPERIERFANMGIRTLGQLLALPARGLARRFGQEVVDYLRRLTGDRPDPRPCIQPAEQFRTTLHLLEPLTSKEALAFPMLRLLGDLQHWLVARQLGAEQLCWHFKGSASHPALSLPVRFARAQQSREAFLDITRLQLAEAELPDEVIGLTLEARRLLPWSGGTRGLFRHLPGVDGGATSDPEPSLLVDQLRARLGRRACYSLEVRDQHAPEHAWRPAPPAGALASRAASGRASPGRASPDRASPGRASQDLVAAPGGASDPSWRARPLWLFDPPRAISPAQLTLLRGPERIQTGWWCASGEATRDYYVARHRNGAQCWVFVDPQQQWFLHGYFS